VWCEEVFARCGQRAEDGLNLRAKTSSHHTRAITMLARFDVLRDDRFAGVRPASGGKSGPNTLLNAARPRANP
jgi:hypothetical protein